RCTPPCTAWSRPGRRRTHEIHDLCNRVSQGPGGARMRVCVVGCGAVGSLFAAALAQVEDVDVWAYDLDEAHVRAINERGLRIVGADELVGNVRATSDAQELPPCDFGIVAVKSMFTDAAMAETARAFANGGAVCSVQNGAGNEELI